MSFRGKHHTEAAKMKNRLAHLGNKRSLESRKKQAASISGSKNHMYGSHINANENNGRWKGDDVGYDALHDWVRKNKPKPLGEVCEVCIEPKAVHAANISGLYLRDVNDYKWLCVKCHSRMDDKPLPPRDPITGRFVRH